MGDKSGISWTDATWNPTTGCDRVSPGCANCYALTMAARLKAMALANPRNRHTFVTGPERVCGRCGMDANETFRMDPDDPAALFCRTLPYMADGDPKTSGPGFGVMTHPDRLGIPLRWTRPRRIFVDSMADLFHEAVPDEFIDRVFAVMALAPQHTFQILTKRPERMLAYMTETWGDGFHEPRYDRSDVVWSRLAEVEEAYVPDRALRTSIPTDWPLQNVWLGTSVENARWRSRIDVLRKVPAAIRFVSAEPLLGPLICPICGGDYIGIDGVSRCTGPKGWEGPHELDVTGIDWLIIGGESGPGARPMDERWVRSIVGTLNAEVTDCIPYVKQMGDTWSREHLGHPGHAADPAEWPQDLRVQDFPE